MLDSPLAIVSFIGACVAFPPLLPIYLILVLYSRTFGEEQS